MPKYRVVKARRDWEIFKPWFVFDPSGVVSCRHATQHMAFICAQNRAEYAASKAN